jgi:hypothetical protein
MRLTLDINEEVDQPISPRIVAGIINDAVGLHQDQITWSLEGDPDDVDDVRSGVLDLVKERETA